ncbi:MAG: TonB-dependent siderophore receptor [Burkholderiales bacterium]|nr:TonB-dependent siderophore receptor [Burkholderiales bacterium]
MALTLKPNAFVGAAAALLATAVATLPSHAQPVAAPERVAPVTLTGKSAPVLDADQADAGGFSAPIAKTPQSITVIGADLLSANGTQSLSSVLKLDASLADAYNTTGYIESLSVRGFLLDQAGNFRRNGLSVSNYAPIALENKDRIEVLKGVAGLQSGVSAPGGLVNYVTKVPLRDAFTTATVAVDQRGGHKAHVDANTNVGALSLRLNVAAENLHPQFDHANGQRQFVSLALATPLSAQTGASVDLEFHRKSQRSVPGLGLLDRNGDGVGETLPSPINPRLNLNNQSWSLPFQATVGAAEVALNHRFNADWSARVAVNGQWSRINDRLAFPDGCSSASTYVYPGLCGNGDVDVYDYRSEGEQRKLASWDLHLDGRFNTAAVAHVTRLGLAGRRTRSDLPPMQTYNYVGTTNVFAPVPLAADGTLSDLNSNSRERALEGYATVQSTLGAQVQSFAGLRVTRLHRASERSDGSRAVAYDQTVSTPWAGLAWTPVTGAMIYGSWGEGAELEVVPNRPTQFVNYGEALPALKSRQVELGAKWQPNARLLVSGALFSIDKPYADDVNTASGLPRRVAGNKVARHRGLELAATGRIDEALSLQASLMLLDATYTRSADPALVGQRVTNVPRAKASLFADYKIAAVRGLALNALASFERGKTALADGSVVLPDAWQLDLGLRYQTQLAGRATLWRLNVENLTNRLYWREAPTTDWGGTYLFPSTPRTLRGSVTIDF